MHRIKMILGGKTNYCYHLSSCLLSSLDTKVEIYFVFIGTFFILDLFNFITE